MTTALGLSYQCIFLAIFLIFQSKYCVNDNNFKPLLQSKMEKDNIALLHLKLQAENLPAESFYNYSITCVNNDPKARVSLTLIDKFIRLFFLNYIIIVMNFIF
jgi:hypothetical protein